MLADDEPTIRLRAARVAGGVSRHSNARVYLPPYRYRNRARHRRTQRLIGGVAKMARDDDENEYENDDEWLDEELEDFEEVVSFREFLEELEIGAEEIDDFIIVDLGEGDYLIRVEVDGEWNDDIFSDIDIDGLYEFLDEHDIDYAVYSDAA